MRYNALAPIYDRLMHFVQYDEWADLIKRVIAKYSLSPTPEILELGAGTGKLGAMIRNMGLDYTASDLSLPMCQVAKHERGHTVCNADARHLPFKKQFGMAIFLYDGINYLRDLNDYKKVFAQVYDVLTPGGLFLFDITTLTNSLKYFYDTLDYEDYGEASFVRHSYFIRKEQMQCNDFTIYSESKTHPFLYEKFIELHRQKVFSTEAIKKTVPKKQFEILGVWDNFSFRKYNNNSLRVHFLLRKRSQA